MLHYVVLKTTSFEYYNVLTLEIRFFPLLRVYFCSLLWVTIAGLEALKTILVKTSIVRGFFSLYSARVVTGFLECHFWVSFFLIQCLLGSCKPLSELRELELNPLGFA